jgi:hypothetical protein
VNNFEASYVEIIRMGLTIGSSGSKYYQAFDSGAQSFLDVEVGSPDNLKRMKATLVAFGVGSKRLLITILTK